jgi:hypothetical protein
VRSFTAGDPIFITGTVVDHDGKPVEGAVVDVWNTSGDGIYGSRAAQHVAGAHPLLTGPIAAVQLNDGSRVHEDYLVHARAARKLPGKGELNISALLHAVAARASPARGVSR